MKMSAEEFRARLTNLDNAHTMGAVAVALFMHPRTPIILKSIDGTKTWGDVPLSLGKVADVLSNDADARPLLQEYVNFITRGAIKETFELIRSYATSKKHRKQVASLPWFNYARIIRNAVSHNGMIQLKDEDFPQIPYRWRDYVIDTSHQGKPVETVLPRVRDGFGLFLDMYSFAMTLLPENLR